LKGHRLGFYQGRVESREQCGSRNVKRCANALVSSVTQALAALKSTCSPPHAQFTSY
jgi:hypothetical protein